MKNQNEVGGVGYQTVSMKSSIKQMNISNNIYLNKSASQGLLVLAVTFVSGFRISSTICRLVLVILGFV